MEAIHSSIIESPNKKLKEKKEILLNHFIFKDISIYLINKLNFKQILEYSLLSKKIFQIIQNILTYRGNECIVEFPLGLLANYIKSCNSISINNLIKYKFKLLQYKDIEHLSIISGESGLSTIYRSLKTACKNLKNVRIVNKYQSSFFENVEDDDDQLMLFDDTFNNFFSFKRVHLNWYSLEFPCSNLKEYQFIQQQIKLYKYNEIQNYSFSFEFLKKLLPQKIYIDGNNCQFELNQLNSILNQSNGISTIKFIKHATPINFFKSALSKSNIKSLSIVLETDNVIIHHNSNQDSDEYIYSILLYSCLDQNKTLKRLILNVYSKNVFGTNPQLLLNLLINNNNVSIEALGLECYDINDDSLLIPLYKLNNIKTLYCRFNNLKYFLLHISKNQNIKKLKIKLDKESITSTNNQDSSDTIELILNETFKLLNLFYKQQKQQPSNNHFKKLVFIYDDQYPLNKNVKSLTKKLNNFILKFKK